MDNRKTFEQKAVRAAEKALGVPPGWWGIYRHIHGPRGIELRFSGSCWLLKQHGKVVSKHDSRSSAIGKAKKLSK